MTKTANSTEITGYALPLSEATALGTQKGWRQRVLIYITRRPHELLVFDHPPRYPDDGIQVPAGGLEAGEVPEQAALRETLEETGLILRDPVHLASYHWTRADTSQIWHYYWLQAPKDTPDTWTHVVSSGDDDQGMTFTHRFVPIERHGLVPNYHYEEALPELMRRLSTPQALRASSP